MCLLHTIQHVNKNMNKLCRKSWNSKISFLSIVFIFVLLSLIFMGLHSKYCPAHPVWSFFGIKRCVKFDDALLIEIKNVENQEWKTSIHLKRPTNDTVLSMFTTFHPDMKRRKAYRNMFKNWKQLDGAKIETAFFFESNSSADTANAFGWRVIPVQHKVCGNPVMRSMFEKMFEIDDSLFYGFANADILFNDGLLKSLEAILKSALFQTGPLLVIGRRQDVFISNEGDPLIDSTFKVEKLGRKARMSHAMAGDFFITNKLFLWKYVPNLAIGRMIIDNWLIWFARATGTKIIDVTATVLALHQRELGFKPFHVMCNDNIARKENMLPDIPIWTGSIECSGYVTQFTSEGEIFITPKIDLPHYCYDESMILS